MVLALWRSAPPLLALGRVYAAEVEDRVIPDDRES